MAEYIDREAAQKALISLPADLDAEAVQRCIETIHNVPAADVVPWEWLKLRRTYGRRRNMRIIEIMVPDDAALMSASIVRAWAADGGAALFGMGQMFDLTQGNRFSFDCENMREHAEADT